MIEPERPRHPKTGMPSVLKFRSYRDFLSRYVEYRKKSGQYSLARFSEDAGFGSKNYASLILSGKRNLTLEDALLIGKFLKMTSAECRYLSLLVLQNDATRKSEQAFYQTWMNEFKNLSTSNSAVIRPSDSKTLISKWYIPGVLSCLHEKVPCTAELASRLTGLKVSLVKAALTELVANGLVEENDSEYLLSASQTLDARFGQHFRFKDFQTEQLARAKRALDTNPETKAVANTILLNEDTRSTLIEKLRDLLNSVDSSQEPDASAVLMQLNLQLFDFKSGN
jgi:uncharacterized protein (TIGR02147 family)